MTRYRSTYRPRRRSLSVFVSVTALIALICVFGYIGYAAVTRDSYAPGPIRSFEQYVDAQEDSARLARTSYEEESAARAVCGEFAIEAIGPDSGPRGWRCPSDMIPPA